MVDFSNEKPTWDSTQIDFSGGIILPPYQVFTIELELYEIARGTAQLQWLPFPFNSPIQYQVYSENGTLILTTQAISCQIAGLAVDTDYLFYVVGDTASPLPCQSRQIPYRYGSTEIEYVYNPLAAVPFNGDEAGNVTP